MKPEPPKTVTIGMGLSSSGLGGVLSVQKCREKAHLTSLADICIRTPRAAQFRAVLFFVSVALVRGCLSPFGERMARFNLKRLK